MRQKTYCKYLWTDEHGEHSLLAEFLGISNEKETAGAAKIRQLENGDGIWKGSIVYVRPSSISFLKDEEYQAAVRKEYEDMSWYPGYVDPGMKLIRKETAMQLFAEGMSVYCLFDDNTESLIQCEEDFNKSNMYGVEWNRDEFSFRQYADNRMEHCGNIVFSHGTHYAEDLLALAKRFLHMMKGSHICNDNYWIVDDAEDVADEYSNKEPQFAEGVWKMTVCLINTTIPDEYRLAQTNTDGDWEFVKLREE